ncbi:PREDICTED: EPIDERMAL PATTERNING FACTOR-like protein 8 [Nicotiana attenuata]|uniref:EPIDERMAL PATTERNING FACTOR-like protein 8 n=1 Tax=Nicotiana attenuata TaxID=49451 RepID=UPI000904FF64|nr:PREDICTED: EPIDERMAL PATTERNING FACTOR-like protein 8 [Nicotiana attenuata]
MAMARLSAVGCAQSYSAASGTRGTTTTSFGIPSFGTRGRSGERKQMRMVMLGSSPPKCVNRCKGCRPCMAVLVIPPHTSTSGKVSKSLKTLYTREDEGYYLLSWKCKCGTKYFQP